MKVRRKERRKQGRKNEGRKERTADRQMDSGAEETKPIKAYKFEHLVI